MGDGSSTKIEAIFVANTDGFNTEKVAEQAKAAEEATAGMSKGLSGVESAAEQASKGLAGVGTEGEAAGKGISELGSASGMASSGVKEVATATAEMSKGLNEVGSVAGQASKGLSEIGSATGQASKGLSEVGASAGQASKGLNEVGASGGQAGKGVSEVGSASGVASGTVKEVGESSKESAAKMKELEESSKAAQQGMNDMMGIMNNVQQIVQFAQMVGQAIAAITQLHDAAVATGDAFLYLTQDADKANSMLSALSETAASKDYGAQKVDDVAQHMLMLGKNSKDVIPEITRAADGLAAMGKNGATLDAVVTSMDKLKQKTTVTMADIDGLADKGLPSWKALADGMGVSVEQAQAKVKAGGVSGSKALDDMMKGLTQYGGAAEKQSQTLGPEWDRFAKNVGTGLSFVGEAFAKLFEGLNSLMEGVDSAADKFQKLYEAAKAVMEMATTIGSLGLNNFDVGVAHNVFGGNNGSNNGVTPSSSVSNTFGLPGHASGGTNLSGLSVIGEDGPELFDPNGGSIYPLDGSSSSLSSLPAMGGQSGPVTIQFYMDSQLLAQQIIPQIAPIMRLQAGLRQ